MRLKGELAKGYLNCNTGEMVEIELPSINPSELKNGQKALYEVTIVSVDSDMRYCIIIFAGRSYAVPITNLVAILPQEVKAEKEAEQDVDFAQEIKALQDRLKQAESEYQQSIDYNNQLQGPEGMFEGLGLMVIENNKSHARRKYELEKLLIEGLIEIKKSLSERIK